MVTIDYCSQRLHKELIQNVMRRHCATIFGSNLTQEGICCIHQLIEFIITDKRIFRKSGSSLRQSELTELISGGITVDLSANRFTVHDCCCVLKKFVSLLPEPLITDYYYPLFKQISELNPQVFSPNHKNCKKLVAIQLFLLLIPAPNRQLLLELLALFEKVLQNSDTNRMTSTSLGTLFTPHVLCPRSFTSIELQHNLSSLTQTLTFMIDNSRLICQPPPRLLTDVNNQLMIIESAKSKTSTSSLAAVNSAHQFCVQSNDTNSDDFTANQMAHLYAYIQSMPNSGTPQKKKWIKRFNRENGKGTPLLKQKKSDSSKKLKTSIGDVLKAGQHFLFGTPDDTLRHNKINKNLFKDHSSPNTEGQKKGMQHLSQTVPKMSSKTRIEISVCDERQECVTPLGVSLENANKKIKLSVSKIGNREPIAFD
ncbi:unnamed protein product [Medioppia subpectinata]|uniref:Rho-GAP domain-containing protein n=1 Tax=Medioppia subpectinata TaxID=1979941 RepID=A0A7R9LCC0_9ACAR|nr:unnamed protein product [Medioppia subpectinata]CAG2117696.1 unnamed protein product [Medioppia subpectinata]